MCNSVEMHVWLGKFCAGVGLSLFVCVSVCVLVYSGLCNDHC